jgi:amino acid adenylation domain-containing protein
MPTLRVSDHSLLRCDSPMRSQLGVHQAFEAQVEQSPDALAVSEGRQTLTYRQVNERANRLSRVLTRRGVGAGALVGLCLDRSIDFVVAVLSVLKAGGAYLPLDPAYPAERLELMLLDGRVPLLIVHTATAGRLPQASVVPMPLADLEAEGTGEKSTNLASATDTDSLAYVMYTSGSTGRPKGVAVPHRAIVRLVRDADFADFSTQQIFLLLAPLSFDASTLEMWGPLLNGGRLAVMPGGQPSLEDLGRVIREEGITTLWLTAGLFHLIVDQRIDALRPLRQLLAGGDVLSVPHVRRFLQEVPGCRLINGYGPTENTTFTCCHTIAADDGPTIPIGKPIHGTAIYVLDASLAPVAAGETGELYAGGDGVALGYLNQPERTAEKFIPNPFGPGLLYRTGDLVRQRPDGVVEFLGRVDNQVKVRGYRIELGEIESALMKCAGVRQAVVDVRDMGAGDKQLVACVVPSPGPAPDLRAALKQALPEYMIPTVWISIPELPLNSNGKVDRAALRQLRVEQAHAPTQAPQSELEQSIAGVWRSVLRVDRVGLHDNFFELGGSSLRLTDVHNRLSTLLKIELPITALFQFPTIDSLAKHLSRQKPAEGIANEVQDRALRQREALARAARGRRR